MKNSIAVQKILYGFTFLVLIPGALIFWARTTENLVDYPGIKSETLGWILMLMGVSLMFWAMGALMTLGQGLPMNAFPPQKFVVSGPYSLFRHPIYLGFAALLAGYFIYTGSASGLWMVTPITILGMAALVLGYEEIDMDIRFPGRQLNPLFGLPRETGQQAGLIRKVACLTMVLLLLFVSNYLFAQVVESAPLKKVEFLITGNRRPVGWNYLLLLTVLSTPFILKSATDLRAWTLWSLIAILTGFLGSLVCLEIYEANLMPSKLQFQTVPAYLLLVSIYSLFRNSRFPLVYGLLSSLPLLSIYSFTLENPGLHLLFSTLIFLGVVHLQNLWDFSRKLSEDLANSWQEWVFGPVRIINHGFYVGGGAFLGVLFAGMLAGYAYAWALLVFIVTVVIFSAIWAQVIEGSEKLKRPFGFYGALVGILFAGLLVWALGFNPWVLIGAISVFMPWVQAIGRIRCLINGCCHGRTTENPGIGIRYLHPRSRVCNISHLCGEPLHPTPLYSILWLLPLGLILLAIWYSGAAFTLIFGLYLILTGIGRFVEEAYRGEVQTPVIRGLRLYQWTAVISIAVGILFTFLKIDRPILEPGFHLQIFLAAMLTGLFVFLAMGVDFPRSNKRFSRLV